MISEEDHEQIRIAISVDPQTIYEEHAMQYLDLLYKDYLKLVKVAEAANHGLELGYWGDGSTENWMKKALAAWKESGGGDDESE